MYLTWLTFGWISPAFPADAPVEPEVKRTSSMKLAPIATRIGGSIGYDIEQRTISGASPMMKQRLILNLQGKAITYISKPYLAQVKANLHFTASKSKYENGTGSYNSIWGDTGLFLVPYSRYPFEAIISKTQNLSGPGFGSLTNQTTRLDLNQRYTPREGKERYQLGYNRSKTEDNSPEIFRQSEWNFSTGSNRFKNQTLLADGYSQRNEQQNDHQSSRINQLLVQHRYLPSSEFSLSNNAIARSTNEDLQSGTVVSKNRELNSVMSYQPRQERYTLLGTARVNLYDYDYHNNPTYTKSANANLSGNYRLSRYINLSASGNANIKKDGSGTSTRLATFQSATANYPIASFDLDTYHYSSRFYGTISNRTSSTRNPSLLVNSESGSVQTVSISPSHGLSRNINLGKGRLDLRFDQSFLASESTRSQAIAKLTHSATANYRRASATVSLSGRDTRSLNDAQDSFQYINFNASVGEEINRYSRFSAMLGAQTTRQTSRLLQSSSTHTTSSVAAHYGHLRAFGVPRLTFDSDLRGYSRSAAPVLAASPSNQGPVDWDNTLSYVVGRLVSEFKVNLSKEGDGKSRSLIWFSIKRYF